MFNLKTAIAKFREVLDTPINSKLQPPEPHSVDEENVHLFRAQVLQGSESALGSKGADLNYQADGFNLYRKKTDEAAARIAFEDERNQEIAEQNRLSALSALRNLGRINNQICVKPDSNGQELGIAFCYGGFTANVSRGMWCEYQTENLAKLIASCGNHIFGYRQTPIPQLKTGPFYPDTGIASGGEILIITSETPKIISGIPKKPKKEPIPEYKDTFRACAQARDEIVNSRLVKLPYGKASIFVTIRMSPEDWAARGSEIIVDALNNAKNEIASDYIAGAWGFPLPPTEHDVKEKPGTRMITLIAHTGLIHKDGPGVVDRPNEIKFIEPKVSSIEKASIQEQEGPHGLWDQEGEIGVNTLGTIKVAGHHKDAIGFSANLVAGFDALEYPLSDPNCTSDRANADMLERERELFFDPPEGQRLRLGQLLWNLMSRMEQTAWEAYDRGATEANRGPTHFSFVQTSFGHEVSQEFMDKYIAARGALPESELEHPKMWLLVETSKWENVRGERIKPTLVEQPFEFLGMPGDGFRRAHHNRREIMMGRRSKEDPDRGGTAFSTNGHGFWYNEQMAQIAVKRRESGKTRFTNFGEKEGFLYCEKIDSQLKFAVNYINSHPSCRVVDYRPGEAVPDFAFDLGPEPQANSIDFPIRPVIVCRWNLHMQIEDPEAKANPRRKIKFLRFLGDAPIFNTSASDSPSGDRVSTIFRDLKIPFWRNLKIHQAQVRPNTSLYMFEQLMKQLHKEGAKGREGIFIEKNGDFDSQPQIAFFTNLFPSIDDDWVGVNARECHTTQTIYLSHLAELFSGKYLHLGFPEAEIYNTHKGQVWEFLNDIGGMKYSHIFNPLNRQLGFDYQLTVLLKVKTPGFAQEHWDKRCKAMHEIIIDESRYDEIPFLPAVFDATNWH